MKKRKLDKKEQAIEKALIKGEYHSVSKSELKAIAESIERRKKDAVLNIRINSNDLESIREKAKELGVPYQSLVSEILHRFAA